MEHKQQILMLLDSMKHYVEADERIEAVDQLYHIVRYLLDGSDYLEYIGHDSNYIISLNDEMIMFDDQEEADAVADLFDTMYGEGTVCTGTYDEREDIEQDCVDAYTGKAYIQIY